ncbi:MAG: hypothetical protein JW850_17395 [Thermoflexales bacterium]|nr:hypothetical protein [Thermoflexales bacterium]
MSIDLVVLLALLGAAVGTWVVVLWWVRQPERHLRAWPAGWNAAGLVLWLVAAAMVAAGLRWSSEMPLPANYLDLASLLLAPGLTLPVLGLACFGIARRPEGRRLSGLEMVALAAFLLGLSQMCTGFHYLVSQAVVLVARADEVLKGLLGGGVMTLIAAGLWYFEVFQAAGKPEGKNQTDEHNNESE